MDTIILSARIGADRRLVVELPPDAPVGEVEVTIRSLTPALEISESLTREQARERLQSAGILSTIHRAPSDAKPLTLEERRQIGQMPSDAQPSEALIDEDRGGY